MDTDAVSAASLSQVGVMDIFGGKDSDWLAEIHLFGNNILKLRKSCFEFFDISVFSHP